MGLKDIHYEILADLAGGDDGQTIDGRYFRPLKRLGLVEARSGGGYKLTAEGRKVLASR